MDLFIEIIKFLIFSFLIVVVSKYILVKLLRNLAMVLNLKSKTVGIISGIATSTPELLSGCFAASSGLISASWYNILSSNIINFIQYTFAIYLNKNQKYLNNTALKLDIIIVLVTIFIPASIVLFSVPIDLNFIPIFLLLLILTYIINKNSHQLYLSTSSFEEAKFEKDKNWFKGNKKKAIKYRFYLSLTVIILFIIGNLLSNTLEGLCFRFSIPEFIIGIALGFITSIPELITFFEAQKHHSKHTHDLEGVIEATNNLLTSNIINLFIIQSLALVLFKIF